MVSIVNPFKSKYTYEQRKIESGQVRSKNPGKCPVIIQRYHTENKIEEIDRNKFLVPNDMTIHGLMIVIRKRIKVLDETQALYLFTEKGSIFTSNFLVSQIYDTYVDTDGYLYLFYNSENTFG